MHLVRHVERHCANFIAGYLVSRAVFSRQGLEMYTQLHRLTRRQASPRLEKFQGKRKLLKILNVKSIFNTVKIFRANSVFQGKRKLLKNPERWKNLIQCIFTRGSRPHSD